MAYDIQNVLVLVGRGLRLIAVNMHYAKFTLWTPKLQILAKTLHVHGLRPCMYMGKMQEVYPGI